MSAMITQICAASLLFCLALPLTTLGAVADSGAPRTVLVDHARVLSGYTHLVDFNRRIETEVQKVREAIGLKVVAREAMVRQANEMVANKPKDISDEDFSKRLQPLASAIENTEKEIRELQAAPDLNREAEEGAANFRAAVRAAVEAEVALKEADLALDMSAVNGAGLAVIIPAKANKLVDITGGVLARLNNGKDVTPVAPASPAAK